jgi:hypothetical protein
MSFRMGIGITILFGVALTAQAAAGTFFRLEVGSPIAAGTDTKVKDVKKAVLVVRPRLCDDEASVRITGTAEGVVNGFRQSVTLKLVALPTPGVHAVQQQWPDGGQWVLHLTGTCPATKAVTSTIVPLTKSGFLRDKTEILPTVATLAQVEAALTAHIRSQS